MKCDGKAQDKNGDDVCGTETPWTLDMLPKLITNNRKISTEQKN